MSTTTSNYALKIYEGSDIFNPLENENVNFQKIDTTMKSIADDTVVEAVENVSGSVHTISFLNTEAQIFAFVAIADYTTGDTFVINGSQVSAFTTDGKPLVTGCYKRGKTVIGALSGNSVVTFFVSSGTSETAEDSKKLGGQLPDYYATKTAVEQAQSTANNRGTVAGSKISKTVDLTDIQVVNALPDSPNPTTLYLIKV